MNDFRKWLTGTNLRNGNDVILKDYLACIFGANEPSEYLISDDHECVIIDNEMMFSYKPTGEIHTEWWTGHLLGTEELPKELSDIVSRVSHITDSDIARLRQTARHFRYTAPWNVFEIARAAREICRRANNVPYVFVVP